MNDSIHILLLGVFIVISGIIFLKLHPFLVLLISALVVAALTPEANVVQYFITKGNNAEAALKLAHKSIGERIATEFGNTCAKIGILIAMAAIIGKALLESGAAERIIRSMLKISGVKKSPYAFLVSSFFLTIPVFVDTVIFLMVPLAKAFSLKIKKNYLLLILCIAGGGAMANSLVPPSPGPLFLVTELNVPIGLMMVCGFLLGLFTIAAGIIYANWANKKWPIDVRDSHDAKLEDLAFMANKPNSELPSIGFSLLPVLFPLITICFRSFVEAFGPKNGTLTSIPIINKIVNVVLFLGDKNIALLIGCLFALLLVFTQKKIKKEALTQFVHNALMSGGGIILITAAGGAFGGILQQTGISSRIAGLTQNFQMALIPLAFLITAVVRTAQGSATVALITTSGILSGMAQQANLGFNPVYLCLAIGCGAKLVPWMNDAGFWVVSKSSNLTEKEMLRSLSPMQTIMGITGLIITMIAAKIFPMI
jgi:gluconate:H+ symporter, GntP family